MQGFRDQLLTGTAFTGNQHRGRHVGEIIQQTVKVLHFFTGPDHFVKTAAFAQGSLQSVKPGFIPRHQHGPDSRAASVDKGRSQQGQHLGSSGRRIAFNAVELSGETGCQCLSQQIATVLATIAQCRFAVLAQHPVIEMTNPAGRFVDALHHPLAVDNNQTIPDAAKHRFQIDPIAFVFFGDLTVFEGCTGHL